MYSLQTGYDYVINIKTKNPIFDNAFNNQFRAKPILVANDNFANYADFHINQWYDVDFPSLQLKKVKDLLEGLDFIPQSTNNNFKIDMNYQYSNQLALVVAAVNRQSTSAKILVPVKFTNFSQNIIYFLPIKTSNNSYEAFS